MVVELMQTDMTYIYEIYRTGSFSQAARNLSLTQPALSIAVKKAEAAIGMPLFDRSRQPLVLTEAGEVYIRRVLEIKQIKDNLAKELADLQEQDTGELHIGGTQYFNSYVLPGIIQAYGEKYPHVRLTLSEDNSGKIDTWLAEGETDMNFHSAPWNPHLFQGKKVFTDELLLAVPRSLVPSTAKCAGLTCRQVAEGRYRQADCPVQELAAFRETPFLILTENNQLRERALAICKEKGFDPIVHFCCEQLETSWHFARHGLGAVFVTNLVITESMEDRLLYYKLTSSHAIRHFHAITRKHAFISRAMRNFVDLVKGARAC